MSNCSQCHASVPASITFRAYSLWPVFVGFMLLAALFMAMRLLILL